MDENTNKIEEELDDLKKELENFQQEKDRVRAILGKVGGVPKFHDKLANVIFISLIIISLIISVIGGDRWRLVMIEFATVALSFKIIYLIHCLMRVNHFKFWILSSIEWRINELSKQVKELQKN